MSKNAYEIRQELLYLAYNLLKDQLELDFRNKLENNRIRHSKGEPEILIEEKNISVEEIFSTVEKLNEFVSKK